MTAWNTPWVHIPEELHEGKHRVAGRAPRVIDCDGNTVADVARHVFTNSTPRDEVAEDHARLIAAAPDLLAACEGLVELVGLWMNGIIKDCGITWDDEADHPPALRAARAAILRATEGK